jgi:Domain of unknown function (DUF4386)
VNSAYLKAFTPQSLYALAYLSVKPHGYGVGVAVIFFGAYCLVAGYLIVRSDFFPKLIGIGLQVAGFCYLNQQLCPDRRPVIGRQIIPADPRACILLVSYLCACGC